MRRALGAGRVRLVRQLAVESLLLALAGGAAGIASRAGAHALLADRGSGVRPAHGRDQQSTGACWLFAALASLASGLVFGIVPALRVSRRPTPREALRERRTRHTGSVRPAQRGLAGPRSNARWPSCCSPGPDSCSRASIACYVGRSGLRSGERADGAPRVSAEPPPSAESGTQTSPSRQARARARAAGMDELIARSLPSRASSPSGSPTICSSPARANESITIPGRATESVATGELNEGLVTPGFFAALRVPLRRGRYLTRETCSRRSARFGRRHHRPVPRREGTARDPGAGRRQRSVREAVLPGRKSDRQAVLHRSDQQDLLVRDRRRRRRHAPSGARARRRFPSTTAPTSRRRRGAPISLCARRAIRSRSRHDPAR